MPRVDSDALWFDVVSAFQDVAKKNYDLDYTPLAKWSGKPWYFENGRPLGGFLVEVQAELTVREPALANFRIAKPMSKLTDLVGQVGSQTAHYVYGLAETYLSGESDVTLL